MQTIELGKSGLKIPRLAVGGNIFGWTVDETQSFHLLDTLLEAGLNFIDTADVYSKWIPGNKGGESETILGKWIKARGIRDRVILATKVGMEMSETDKGLSRAHILKSIDASLKRLNTDYVDLYQSHKDDPAVAQEETLSAYAELIKAGKVRAIGASNFSADRLKAALDISEKQGLPRYESLQPHYNLIDRAEFEKDLEKLCLAKGLGVIPYFSLASGFLTGKYRSEKDFGKSSRGAGMAKYMNPRGMRILDALDEVAKAQGSTPASVALAWLIARPSISAPIASATSDSQIESLVAATRLALTKEEIQKLDKASAD